MRDTASCESLNNLLLPFATPFCSSFCFLSLFVFFPVKLDSRLNVSFWHRRNVHKLCQAATIRAKMMAAKEETDEATKAETAPTLYFA